MNIPREHGAYAQLAFPLITGMVWAVPTLSTLALGAAAIALFLGYEPVAIVLGARGTGWRSWPGGGTAGHRSKDRHSWALLACDSLGRWGCVETGPGFAGPGIAV